MNPRCAEIQALVLERLFRMMPWPEGWGLVQFDGQWMLAPIKEPTK